MRMWYPKPIASANPFSISDIGLNKATVLINRINLFWGTQWKALPFHLDKRARYCDRERRPALDPARSRHRAEHLAMDRHRVRPHTRRIPAARRDDRKH